MGLHDIRQELLYSAFTAEARDIIRTDNIINLQFEKVFLDHADRYLPSPPDRSESELLEQIGVVIGNINSRLSGDSKLTNPEQSSEEKLTTLNTAAENVAERFKATFEKFLGPLPLKASAVQRLNEERQITANQTLLLP